MKTLLQYRADRLFAEPACPLCHSHKTGSYRGDEVTRPADTKETPALVGHFTPNPDDKAAVRFYCGAEFAIDKRDRLVSHIPCSLAMRNVVEEMETEAEMLFDEQEEAA